ncbi:metallophosphoesterase [Citreicella sp. C3M06]|uniref:metallophosphoesterase family protein n=1 Tax=Citreicella sp. C3M06 TaxID=2841564 RepID=UPI001C09229F|nr:metallophosphoesterase [Citreicella sp. C3M06]MBU2959809.1 metallophosphoesterase [Citreicella sp. C3M06]
MTKVTILHFSDIHWHSRNEESVRTVQKAMIEDIVSLKRNEAVKFDLALFTGDLVLVGENKEDFKTAHSNVLRPILDAAELSEDLLFICPGNHDVSRRLVREADFIEQGLKVSLKSVDAVNQHLRRLDESDVNAMLAMSRMSNFNEYYDQTFQKADATSGTVKVHRINVNNVSVGVASFDNSWRATGEAGGVDRNHLLLGERNVDFAVEQLADVDLAIGIFHHPGSWLAEFDAASVQPRLSEGFDLLAYGHVHATEPEIRTTVNGNALMSQSGSLYAGREYYNGYQIIEIDPEICRADYRLRTYFDNPGRRFGPAENIVSNGRASFEYRPTRGKYDPHIELALREIRPEVRRLALDQLNISDLGAEFKSDPHDAFICPPIFESGQEGQDHEVRSEEADASGELSPEHGPRKELSLSDILESDRSYLLVGAREVGKTSLAHYAAVLVSEGQTDKPRIPVIIDYRKFKGNLYSLKRLAAAYLGPLKSGFDFEAALENGSVVIIVDNFDGLDQPKKTELQSLILSTPSAKWILLSDSRFGALNKRANGNDLLEGVNIASISSLPRRSIRTIVRRWCERTGASDEDTFTTIMSHIRDSDLPRTGYIVTMLLWALHQNNKLDRINESVLIMNMVDYLLGKADFQSALESEFDATSKEITLQSFACFLRDQGGTASSNDATQFLITFFRDKGLSYDASSVLASLCECGVLYESANSISFKYRCFQEYFIAKHIGSSDKRLKESYLNRAFLRNQRELQILSGLSRENDGLIDEVIYQLENYSPQSIGSISLDRYEDVIEEESSVGISREKLRRIRKKKLTATQVDDLMDAAEARLASNGKPEISSKPRSDVEGGEKVSSDLTPSSIVEDNSSVLSQPNLKVTAFMSALSLLGKVLRNSEFTDKARKIDGVRIYTQNSVRFFLFMYEVISDVFSDMVDAVNQDDAVLDEEAVRGLHYFLTKRMMLFVDSRMVDDLASVKLIPVMEEVLNSAETSTSEKTFLVGVQLDCPNPNWNKHWAKHSKEFKKHRISNEFLADKLWQHIHTKALDTREQSKVEQAALDLELALGRPKAAKSAILQGIRSASLEGKRRNIDE